MQLWITLGFVGVVGVIAVFLMHFIGTALNGDDTERIDEIPENHLQQ